MLRMFGTLSSIEIRDRLGIVPPNGALNKSLRVMVKLGLVTREARGQIYFYSLPG
jgi:hypothetical protein